MDITRIMLFCKEHEHLLGENGPPLHVGYLRRQIKQCIKEKDTQVFITVNKDNRILGLVVCWIAPYLWSRQLYVTDILFVADQGGDVLMKKMEAWGKANGARVSTMQTHLGLDDRVEKLYERKGYERVGAVFEKPMEIAVRRRLANE